MNAKLKTALTFRAGALLIARKEAGAASTQEVGSIR
jgi:hypothetical protein